MLISTCNRFEVICEIDDASSNEATFLELAEKIRFFIVLFLLINITALTEVKKQRSPFSILLARLSRRFDN